MTLTYPCGHIFATVCPVGLNPKQRTAELELQGSIDQAGRIVGAIAESEGDEGVSSGPNSGRDAIYWVL
jgi:hypothetical protein